MGSVSIEPFIHSLGSSCIRILSFTTRQRYPWEITYVRVEYEAECDPETVRVFWNRGKSVTPKEFRTPDYPAHHCND